MVTALALLVLVRFLNVIFLKKIGSIIKNFFFAYYIRTPKNFVILCGDQKQYMCLSHNFVSYVKFCKMPNIIGSNFIISIKYQIYESIKYKYASYKLSFI